MIRTSVIRVPIKIRKPIHKNFCKCWGIQVFSIEGVAQFINGNRFSSITHLRDFLEEVTVCLPIHFTYRGEATDSMIELVISKGIPVVINTNRVLPDYTIEQLKKIPHSGIQVSIDSLDGFIEGCLGSNDSEISDLREMLFLAKSWKIFTSLAITYYPHLVSKLDLFEMVDMIKNHISHILISFPDISDYLYHECKPRWEVSKPSSIEKFKSYYTADVPSRTWKVKQGRKEDIVSSLNDFLKGKKITVEEMGHHLQYNGMNRVRHISSGMSNLPLGIRPFFYEKEEGIFRVTEGIEGFTCPKCEKPIFG